MIAAAESVVTIGTFDGVHLGHRAVLAETRSSARGRCTRSQSRHCPSACGCE